MYQPQGKGGVLVDIDALGDCSRSDRRADGVPPEGREVESPAVDAREAADQPRSNRNAAQGPQAQDGRGLFNR